MGLQKLYAFVNIEEARRCGIDIDKIHKPEDIFGSPLDNDNNPVFFDREEIIKGDEFKRYDSDPGYKKIEMSYN